MNLKRFAVLLAVAVMAAGCSKKEDAPKPQDPHVAGMWSGNGTDDAIGYYNIGITLTQTEDSAAGTFNIASNVATETGNVMMSIGPLNGNNMQTLTLTRTAWTTTSTTDGRICQATMRLTTPTFITNTHMQFSYQVTDCQGGVWNGGANLSKIAGTN
jgi:hypothetical protein